MRITPDMLAAGYDFLRTTEPFRAWNLPESDDIGFAVLRTNHSADFGVNNGTPIIRVSERRNKHSNTILMTVAHECIHLYQHLHGLSGGGEHNGDFRARAARICKIHGWDEGNF